MTVTKKNWKKKQIYGGRAFRTDGSNDDNLQTEVVRIVLPCVVRSLMMVVIPIGCFLWLSLQNDWRRKV